MKELFRQKLKRILTGGAKSPDLVENVTFTKSGIDTELEKILELYRKDLFEKIKNSTFADWQKGEYKDGYLDALENLREELK